MRLGCIVEGQGEELALPILLRRIGAEQVTPPVVVEQPALLRVPRQKLVRMGEIERSIDFLARRLARGARILVLIDADDDLPCELGPALLARARAARPDLTTSVVVANREFEAWFLASVESLAGCRGLSLAPPPIPDPEQRRGAKQQLSTLLGGHYSPVLHQPAFAARMNLDRARRAPSFDKLYREVVKLLGP